MSTLAIVPTYLVTPNDLAVTLTCLESIRRTAPDLEVLVVDDHSASQELVDEMEAACSRLEFELFRKTHNTGFSRTVNVGLLRALNDGRDAVLMNADLEMIDMNWLEVMKTRTTEDGTGLASIVGGLLIYPTGLIQHAGIFFSLLHRCFDHIYKYAPADLPEAQKPRRCPVTGALQFIRHECLVEVGLYDEGFRMGWEDVDYCIRAWMSGREIIYEPRVRAYHYESMFRGRPSPKIEDWQQRSWIYFMEKHRATRLTDFVPNLI